MARIESAERAVKVKGEREVMQNDASVAFDPFLQVAVNAPKLDALLISDGMETGGGEARGVANQTLGEGDVDSIAELNPAQQAILKMMASPPRGQDPLGMMAQVEQDLQGGAQQEPGKDTAGNAGTDVMMEKGVEKERVGAQNPKSAAAEHRVEVWGVKANEGQSVPRMQVNSPGQSVGQMDARAAEVNVQAVVKQAESGVVQLPRLEGGALARMQGVMNATGPAMAGGSNGGGSTGTVSAVAVTGVTAMKGVGGAGGQATGIEKGLRQGGEQGESVDEMKVQAQALRGVIAALRKKGEQVTVVLRPEALGKVKVDLKFGEGGVRGVLTCSTDSARELLDRTVDGLQRAMESRGIVVERLEVVHDPKMDSFGDAGAGARQDGHAGGERAPNQGGAETRGAGGTGADVSGMAEAAAEEAVVLAYDPVLRWDGSRLALSTLA